MRRRFFVACAVGALAAGLIFLWFVLDGGSDLLRRDRLGNFYDAQARSLLDLRWDIPPEELSLERFVVDGKAYMYFGPWPALLRIPALLVGDVFGWDLDGRLTQLSMLLAFAVAMAFVTRLTWRVRTLVRGDADLTRFELVTIGALVFVLGAGSTVLFLAGRTWVYHEAMLWGIALALGSYSFLVEYLIEPRRQWLVLAAALAALAFLSRATVGSGPVMALTLLLVARAAARGWARWVVPRSDHAGDAPWLRWLGLGKEAANRQVLGVLVAVVVALGAYAYVNYTKFETPFGLPINKQTELNRDPNRREALAANEGNLFGFRFVPTNLLEYWRPDAIGFDRLFPWVTFSKPATVVGDVRFDTIDFAAGIPATSTVLVVLGGFGLWAVAHPPRRDENQASDRDVGTEPHAPHDASVLRVPILGAAIGGAGTFVFGYLAQRYTGDFAPLLVLSAVPGALWLLRARDERGTRRRLVRVAVAGLVVLAAWSCFATFALALQYQKTYGAILDASTRAGFVDFQLDVDDALGSGQPSGVERGPELPADVAPEGTFFVVGDCDGLYWSNGKQWQAVERTPATGEHHLRVMFPRRAPGTVEPLLVSSDDDGSSLLLARYLPGSRVRFDYEWTGEFPVTAPGDAIRVTPDEPVPLAVRMDALDRYVEVVRDGRKLLAVVYTVAAGPATLGARADAGSGEEDFSGKIVEESIPTPVCDRLV